MTEPRTCDVCDRQYTPGRRYTCSQVCHDFLLARLLERYGEFKKVVDYETGLVHKVPTLAIMEKGLTFEELKKCPLWEGR